MNSPFIDFEDIKTQEDQWTLSNLFTHQIGEAKLSLADNTVAESAEYKVAGCDNPLLVINDPKQKISENFSVGEFAQAASGQSRWKFARIDPALVENVQRLRSFINKPVEIVDSYYTPKYLKEVLKITDPATIARNPHICGKGVKISVKGYERTMRDIAAAAVVACKYDVRNMNFGIGHSTMTLYVKQPYNEEKQVTSYIKEEESKWPEIKFGLDFITLFLDAASAYENELQSATAKLARSILTEYYTKKWKDDWKTGIHDVISIMFGKSQSKNPGVVLYALAYSSFGCLYRAYLKDKGNGTQTVEKIITMVRPPDTGVGKGPGSFFWAINQFDKSEFIKICYSNMAIKTPGETAAVFKSFYDWQHDKKDRDFYNAFKDEIALVNTKFGYTEDISTSSPTAGSKRDWTISAPNPDKPVYYITGRYWHDFPDSDKNYYGLFLLLNQAGNYVSGKIGHVFKKSLTGSQTYTYGKKTIGKLRDAVELFYGKMENDGTIKGFIYPQKIVYIKKHPRGDSINLRMDDHGEEKSWDFRKRSAAPSLSASVVDAFIKADRSNEDLLITLAWAYPLPRQLRQFNEYVTKSEKEITIAIRNYYNPTSDIPNVRKNEMENAIRKLDNNIYPSKIVNYHQFAGYYIRFYYSKSKPWQPHSGTENRSTYGWIIKMLEDFRDQASNAATIQRDFKGLYDFFEVDTRIPPFGYKYKINIVTSITALGPFGKTSGKVIIENVTNYAAYPRAKKWDKGNKAEYPISLWQASLSLEKWRPKISGRFEAEAETRETPIFYLPTDFSDASVDMQEWTAFEVSVGKDVGSNRVELSGGLTKRLVTIAGAGEGKLQFEELETTPYIPDTITFQPKEDDEDKLFDYSLPAVTFFKGHIGTKKITDVIKSEPLVDKFNADYQLTSFSYFKHDHAPLLIDAINAIGKMCAEELSAFTDPASVVEIKGHADASGSVEDNKKLSLIRAQNVQQAIQDRLGKKLQASVQPVQGLGEEDANKFGQFREKNAWRRRVFVVLNGRAVLMLGQ
jgi:outer membrane protein OmpA-like peptidoglycan-associated protein